MSVKISHSITLLGREHQLRSSSSAAEVKEVADLINRVAGEVAGLVKSGDSQQIMLLTLLNIAERYLAEQRVAQHDRRYLDDRIGKLVTRIDKALG